MLNIAVVNDSLLAAESMRRVIDSVPDYTMVWVAHNGREAIDKCAGNCPDIILMDLFMPEMDGVEATRRISAEFGCAILVVTATVDGHAGKVFEAMGAGALDAINTPILGASGHGEGRDALIRKIDNIAKLLQGKPVGRNKRTREAGPVPGTATAGVPLIALGASTGGPAALVSILTAMPASPGVGLAIVQHVDAQFMDSFTSWLDKQAPMQVRQARPGDRFEANTALVCGREDHLVLKADGTLDYTPQPLELAYRPSVDVFFASLAENQTNQTVGVLLTGMGRDGARGLQAMRERDWLTIAQDERSCAVYGMPKAAKELDAATEILPLGQIGPALSRWAQQVASGGKGKQRTG